MFRVKLIIGLLFMLMLPKFTGNNTPVHWDSKTCFNYKTAERQQKKDYTCGILQLTNDSTVIYRADKQPIPNTHKFLRSLKNGHLKYSLNRVWLNCKDLINKGFKNTESNTAAKYAHSLFRIVDYRFSVDFDQPIGACSLRDSDGHIIGNLIWADDKLTDVAYLSHPDSMFKEVETLQDSNQLLAIFSASYFDETNQPVGFHSKNGEVINKWFNTNWDGFVMVYRHQLIVSNLQTMELIGCTEKEHLSETNNSVGLSTWAFNLLDNQCTSLQLPLLVFNNELMLDYRITPYRLREMRLLCKVEDKQKRGLYLLVNINKPDYLPNMIYSLMGSLQARDISVLYSLLLDVGSNNLLQVYHPNNQINRSFKGLIPIEKANNAFTFILKKSDTHFTLKFDN